MPRDADTVFQERLLEQIHRFPEQYPVSMGGLRRDPVAPQSREAQLDEDQRIVDELNEEQHRDYADRAVMDPLDPANIEPLDGDEGDPMDSLGVHALDDGDDTFEPDDDRFDPEY